MNSAGKYMVKEAKWLISVDLRYFQERGYTVEALDCYRIAQANVEHIIDTRHDKDPNYVSKKVADDEALLLLAETHNNIAGSATEVNDADTALHHFQIYNKMLVDEHDGQTDIADSRLTSSFFNLGLSFTMKEEYGNAISRFNEALVEAERLPDAKKAKVARSLALINLGLTHWIMDSPEEASEFLTAALQEREEMLGTNDRESMM